MNNSTTPARRGLFRSRQIAMSLVLTLAALAGVSTTALAASASSAARANRITRVSQVRVARVSQGTPTLNAHASASPTPSNAKAASKPATTSKSSTPSTAKPAKAQAPLRPMAALPASTCTLAANVRSCDLYAMTGTSTLPGGATTPIWGFAATSAGPATLPGPVLIANSGETLNITLHNVNVPTATSLSLSQAAAPPDTTGVTQGNSTTYTFNNVSPGTYLYEAGLTANGPRETAMGMYGALVVRPASCAQCAYDSNSAFDDEAVVVLSEIDPALNADPLNFNMPSYNPKYWLINGQSYPNTAAIGTNAGHKVLLRYANAGLEVHSISILGLDQTIVGVDGKVSSYQEAIAADTVPAGASLDAIASVPTNAAAGSAYPLFEAAMHLDNNGTLSTTTNPLSTISTGGMLAFVQVAGGFSPSTAPVTSNVTLSPNPTNGGGTETLNATATSSTANITAMEYFVDQIGPNGSGTAISSAALGGGQNVTVQADVTAALNGLAAGNHAFYVHAQDANGQWGDVSSAVLNLVKSGPVMSNMSLTPNPTNGTSDVQLLATASDAANGNQNVQAAEYFIDPSGTPAGGSGTALDFVCTSGVTPPCPAPTVSLSATLTAATVAGLPEGAHTIAVRAQDALGNWGTLANITLKVDKTGPATSNLSALPSPTNGQWGNPVVGVDAYYEVISANFSDPVVNGANGNITAAEYFVDTTGANGSGTRLQPANGAQYNSPNSSGYAWVQLWQIAALAEGQHMVYVHAQDAAGNWGPMASVALIIDKTGPTVSNLAVTAPNAQNQVTLTGTATDPNVAGMTSGSSIIGAEYFIGSDPGAGNGTPLNIVQVSNPANFTGTITVSGAPTFNVRAEDAAHNWGPVVQVSVTRPNAIFANGFDSGTLSGWSATGGTAARLAVVAAARQSGAYGLRATVSSGTSGYVQDNTPSAETSYYAKFYLNPNTLAPGTHTVTIFTGLNGANAQLFSVQLRKSGTTYQVAVSAVGSGTTTTSSWVNLTSGFNAIEVFWQSSTSASVKLWVNNTNSGSPNATISPIDTSANTLETVRLGPQGTLTGVSGNIYLDTFS